MRGSVGGRKGGYLAAWGPPNGCCHELLVPYTVGINGAGGFIAHFLVALRIQGFWGSGAKVECKGQGVTNMMS